MRSRSRLRERDKAARNPPEISRLPARPRGSPASHGAVSLAAVSPAEAGAAAAVSRREPAEVERRRPEAEERLERERPEPAAGSQRRDWASGRDGPRAASSAAAVDRASAPS